MRKLSESNFEPGSDLGEDSSEFAIIGRYRTARMAHESGLSVLVAGHHYWIQPIDGSYVLIVPRGIADAMRREVEIGEFYNRFWPPASLDLPLKATSKTPTVVAILILLIVYWAQQTNGFMVELGHNSSVGVLMDGEWWRLLTAVTLHANVGHLAGNIFGISLFAYLSCRYMGNGLAWLIILLTAGLSNLTNDILHAGEAFRSLGASTAVFAALGLLTGFPVGVYFRTKEPIMSRDWLIPFFGGCILFAWMGGGEFPTDVTGHLWSFFYGLVIALPMARTAIHSKISPIQQRWLLLVPLLLLTLSWSSALAHG